MEQTAEKMNASPEAKESVATPKPDRQRLGENSSGGTVTLGVDDRLEGKLIIRSDLVVLGSIEGEVITTGDVSVEATAVVKARLECRNLSIRGRVEGEVTAQQRLRLAGSGYLQGNIRVGKLHVEDGATFNGTDRHGERRGLGGIARERPRRPVGWRGRFRAGRGRCGRGRPSGLSRRLPAARPGAGSCAGRADQPTSAVSPQTTRTPTPGDGGDRQHDGPAAGHPVAGGDPWLGGEGGGVVGCHATNTPPAPSRLRPARSPIRGAGAPAPRRVTGGAASRRVRRSRRLWRVSDAEFG